ncbi:MAG TPA: ATP-binding cassette domain-containing protein [Mucilaginibacter sp.]|nr:ATP-binding cassette domain-containing protein [Mucilaginibacter sp.]
MVLKVDSVQLEFDGRKILQDVWLECKVGEVVGLLGRNGSGKSCLLRIIFGSLAAQFRYVSINDEFIAKGYINNRIAYLPQHNYLPKGIKIFKLAVHLVDERFWKSFAAHPAYQNHHHKTIQQLSGGELRQLETLMVIYGKADFILLDEPFTHISPIQADDFKAIIKQCSKHKGIIVTDHQYRNIIDVSDRLIVIANGCTKPVTSPDDLVTYNYLSGNN